MSFLGSLYAAAASKPRRPRKRAVKRARPRKLSFLDRLFMAAAPAPALEPSRKARRASRTPVEPRPFKPVRKAKAARVKLLTTAKTPLGSRHFERVAEIGPYVPGFYVVRNVDGKAVVYRRSAVEMRRYPAHLGYPCP